MQDDGGAGEEEDEAARDAAVKAVVDDYIRRLKCELQHVCSNHEDSRHSFVPSGFKPHVSVKDARLNGIRQLLEEKTEDDDDNIPIDLQPGGSAINERTPGIYTMSFPSVFFFGSGDISTARARPVNHAVWVQWLMDEENMAAARHPTLRFYLLNVQMRRNVAQSAQMMAKDDVDLKDLATVDDLDKLSDAEINYIEKRLHRRTKKIKGTPAFMRQRRVECKRFFEQAGVGEKEGLKENASFFATASFADLHCPMLHSLIVSWAGLQGSSRDPFCYDTWYQKESYSIRLANVRDYPTMVVFFFDEKARIFHEKVLPFFMGIDPSLSIEDKHRLKRYWYVSQ
jgi:hypothetical protein